MNGEPELIIDPDVLIMLRESIGDRTTDIIRLYLDDVPNSLQHMFKALDAADLVTVGRLAHSLKSSSANLGAMRTSKLAAKLESAINDGLNDPAKILEFITNLQLSFDRSVPLFSDYLK